MNAHRLQLLDFTQFIHRIIDLEQNIQSTEFNPCSDFFSLSMAVDSGLNKCLLTAQFLLLFFLQLFEVHQTIVFPTQRCNLLDHFDLAHHIIFPEKKCIKFIAILYNFFKDTFLSPWNMLVFHKHESHYGYLPLICIFICTLPNCRMKLRKQLKLADTITVFWFWFTHMYRYVGLPINKAREPSLYLLLGTWWWKTKEKSKNTLLFLNPFLNLSFTWSLEKVNYFAGISLQTFKTIYNELWRKLLTNDF